MSETTDNITETEATEQQEPQEEPQEPTEQQEPDTFPRDYVEKLRREAAGHRERAKAADDLREALWTARVAATGRLADPTDLAMPEDADPLDAEAVDAAVDALLERKPHLAARAVAGPVGAGEAGQNTDYVDLAGILRARS